uniref:HERV-H LTR-associating 1 n=1 Tax=Anser cygnoides TaxID=8845 RepID=A0A8B9DJQ7_ANSCY
NLICGSSVAIKAAPKKKKNLFLLYTNRGLAAISRCSEALSFPELPAKSVDLAALNLTELVNGMLSTALRGTKKLFSLLSVTSYSSFAFHKVSVTVYNISSLKNVDPGKFPMHYCYCLNNVTNDLTDFTALLVDIIGNSTSYLTEIFKSTSILSVRQSNDSDCIYICVMTGQTGRNPSDFWEILEKSPVINYTFSSNASSDLGKYILGNKKKQQQQQKPCPGSTCNESEALEEQMGFSGCILGSIVPQHVTPAAAVGHQHSQGIYGAFPLSSASPATSTPLALKGEDIPTTRSPPWPKTVGVKGSGFPSLHVDASRPRGTVGAPPAAGESLAPSSALQTSPGEFCAEDQNLLYPISSGAWPKTQPKPCFRVIFFLGCPQAILKESRVTSPPVTVIVQINPCVMELCRFFQLCLCVGRRKYSRKEAMRYCVEYYSWFLKNASYVCEQVKRVAYSHTLKQKCLKNICKSV